MPLSMRLESGFPAKGAVADDPDVGDLDGLAIRARLLLRKVLAFCCL